QGASAGVYARNPASGRAVSVAGASELPWTQHRAISSKHVDRQERRIRLHLPVLVRDLTVGLAEQRVLLLHLPELADEFAPAGGVENSQAETELRECRRSEDCSGHCRYENRSVHWLLPFFLVSGGGSVRPFWPFVGLSGN